jgi:hypothetical protein
VSNPLPVPVECYILMKLMHLKLLETKRVRDRVRTEIENKLQQKLVGKHIKSRLSIQLVNILNLFILYLWIHYIQVTIFTLEIIDILFFTQQGILKENKFAT